MIGVGGLSAWIEEWRATNSAANSNPQSLVDTLAANLRRATGRDELRDDVTLLAIRITGGMKDMSATGG
jgi:serine phosphatase RsbU (regulator of sigma subunit)